VANPKATGVLPVWQETFPVRFGAVDRSDRLRLSAVFQFFQEAAISHAENLCVGREDMANAGHTWILSRMSVQVDRRPDYRETVTVRSWPRGGEKLFALRDYDIRAGDTVCVRARSGWIVLDLKTRRPLRPQVAMNAMPLNEGLDALAGVPPSLPNSLDDSAGQNGWQKTGERRAAYTDLDYNGHVNNVRYVQWIEDAVDMTLLEKAGRVHLELNYLSEILGGDSVEIWSAPLDAKDAAADVAAGAGTVALGAFSFDGKNKESGKSVFRAELTLWE